MQSKKPKSLKKLELNTSTTKNTEFLYSDELLQSAIKRGARNHPPLYECKNCGLQFKNLASFAPHTRHFSDHGKCRTLLQILSTGRYKQITYTDDFLCKSHTCISTNPTYVPNPNTENINNLANKYDVDRMSKHFDKSQYEYITDVELIGKKLKEYGEAAKNYIPKPLPVKESFEMMVDKWLQNSISFVLDSNNTSKPNWMKGEQSYQDYYQIIKDMTFEQLSVYNKSLTQKELA